MKGKRGTNLAGVPLNQQKKKREKENPSESRLVFVLLFAALSDEGKRNEKARFIYSGMFCLQEASPEGFFFLLPLFVLSLLFMFTVNFFVFAVSVFCSVFVSFSFFQKAAADVTKFEACWPCGFVTGFAWMLHTEPPTDSSFIYRCAYAARGLTWTQCLPTQKEFTLTAAQWHLFFFLTKYLRSGWMTHFVFFFKWISLLLFFFFFTPPQFSEYTLYVWRYLHINIMGNTKGCGGKSGPFLFSPLGTTWERNLCI